MLARHYGPDIDRDLLLTAALIHDIGKVREIGAQPGFPYTDEGKLLGHILIGLQLVADAARQVPALPPQRLLLLQHLSASHRGRYEWQSPREPRILEGLILHYADDLDAKMNQAAALVARVDKGWTAYDRSFARDFLRHRLPDEGPAADAREEQPRRSAAGPDPSARGGAQKPPRAQPEPPSPAANGRWAEDSLDLFGAEEDEGAGGKD
jgi:3'-5' exoribonuclease